MLASILFICLKVNKPCSRRSNDFAFFSRLSFSLAYCWVIRPTFLVGTSVLLFSRRKLCPFLARYRRKAAVTQSVEVDQKIADLLEAACAQFPVKKSSFATSLLLQRHAGRPAGIIDAGCLR